MTEQHRLMSMVVGDFAVDGHGRSETSLVELRGNDLSDERLNDAYQRSMRELDFDPIFEMSQETVPAISSTVVQRLMDAGFDYLGSRCQRESPMMLWVSAAPGDDEDVFKFEINMDEVILWMITRLLEDVTFTFIEPSNLVGGWSPALKSPRVSSQNPVLMYDSLSG